MILVVKQTTPGGLADPGQPCTELATGAHASRDCS